MCRACPCWATCWPWKGPAQWLSLVLSLLLAQFTSSEVGAFPPLALWLKTGAKSVGLEVLSKGFSNPSVIVSTTFWAERSPQHCTVSPQGVSLRILANLAAENSLSRNSEWVLIAYQQLAPSQPTQHLWLQELDRLPYLESLNCLFFLFFCFFKQELDFTSFSFSNTFLCLITTLWIIFLELGNFQFWSIPDLLMDGWFANECKTK